MSIAEVLDKLIKDSNIPIYGISIGNEDDKNTWRIDFTPATTPEQKNQAQIIVSNFDKAAYESDKLARDAAEQDAIVKWQELTLLQNKSPDEIETIIGDQIDSWILISDIKRDLKSWLPALMASVSWRVMKDEHTS